MVSRIGRSLKLRRLAARQFLYDRPLPGEWPMQDHERQLRCYAQPFLLEQRVKYVRVTSCRVGIPLCSPFLGLPHSPLQAVP